MTDVLVLRSSRMGSTKEIAEAIGAELRAGGLSVDVHTATDAPDPAGYRAVILGRALYLRRWRPDAVAFLLRYPVTLHRQHVWLFQSGPTETATSTPRTPTGQKTQHTAAHPSTGHLRRPPRRGTRPRPAGPLDGKDPELCGDSRDWLAIRGDSRDWLAIRAWARDIRDELNPAPQGRRAPSVTDPHALGNLW